MRTKLLSVIAAASVAVTSFAALTITAGAADYIDAGGQTQTADATTLTNTSMAWGDNNWYIAEGTVTISSRITVT